MKRSDPRRGVILVTVLWSIALLSALAIGPASAQAVAAVIAKAGTVIWNGPVGVFEFDAFGHGTEAIARAIAASSAFSIAGGGDTLAAIAKYGIEGDVGYISTGGGALRSPIQRSNRFHGISAR